MNWVALVAIVSMGVMIGTEFSVAVFINPTLSQLEPAISMLVIRKFAVLLGRVMPFWYGGNLLLLIIETVLRWHQPHPALLIAAVILWACSIVGSIVFLVPINNRIAAGSYGDMAQARTEHGRWDGLHRLRVVVLIVAMLCYLTGIVV